MHGNAEWGGWTPQLNYGRVDSNGNLGLWEWAGDDPDGGILWSGVLLGYRPPAETPEEFVDSREKRSEATKEG